MGYVEGNCPKCGEKVREKTDAWAYGSPIRYCTKCKQEYLDRRFREVAIQGFDPRSESPAFYAKMTVIVALLTAASGGWLYYTTHVKSYYSTLTVAILVACGFATLFGFFMILRNVMGVEKRNNERALAESKRRLQNPDYVKKLQEYGYRIPEEFL